MGIEIDMVYHRYFCVSDYLLLTRSLFLSFILVRREFDLRSKMVSVLMIALNKGNLIAERETILHTK